MGITECIGEELDLSRPMPTVSWAVNLLSIECQENFGAFQSRVRREDSHCFLSPFPTGLSPEGMVSCVRLSIGAGGFHGGLVNSAAAGKHKHSACVLHVSAPAAW